jgi:hypothetical protein
MGEVEMAGFNALFRTRKNNARIVLEPIEKDDAVDKRDLSGRLLTCRALSMGDKK